jgi:tetratricopeptide (TPR) repeat protein
VSEEVDMAGREGLLAALRARLNRKATTGDAALVLAQGALDEAHQLAGMLQDNDDDSEIRYVLGWLHWRRHQLLPDRQHGPDLDAAITMFTRCFIAGAGEVPDAVRAEFAKQAVPIAVELLQDAIGRKDPKVISVSVELWQYVVDASSANSPSWPDYLSSLAVALQVRFGITGLVADLDAGIEAGRAAVDATPPTNADRAVMLSNLGSALRERFEKTGELADLDEAIRSGQTAVNAVHESDPRRAGYLSNLGMAFEVRFEQKGAPADLDAAIEAERAAVEATDASDPARARFLSNLSTSLRAKSEQAAEPADLDAAIEAGRAAVTTADDHDRDGFLSGLGVALQVRFRWAGALADLNEAIDAERAAVSAAPPGHPRRAARLSDLGAALQTRFRRTGVPADLNEAIDAGRAAVEATSPGHASRALHLANLSAALQTRYGQTGALADLDEAIQAGQAAAELTPPGHPGRGRAMSNLGNALRARFERTGMLADVDAAIDAGRIAVEATGPSHAHRAGSLFNLGNALRARFERTGDLADREAAASAFITAAGLGLAAPSLRIRAARSAAAQVAQAKPGLAADLLENAVRLLGEVAPRQLARSDQQHAIGGVAGLASEAAAFALADLRGGTTSQQRAARALQLLEAGRGVLLSRALDTRNDLTDLRSQHPQLAQRFIELRDRLDQPEDAEQLNSTPMTVTAAPVVPGRAAEDRREVAEEFAATLAEIRALEAFASFGLPPATGELLAQAAWGPVVTFNVNLLRSDALLVTTAGVTSIELPRLTPDALTEQIDTFHQALQEAANTDADRATRMAAQRTLADVLEWLWDVAAEPVLEALNCRQPLPPGAVGPQVWWIPGGPLGLLPIHAAGHHTEPPPGGQGRRTVIDRVISSYTPTIHALHYARQHLQHAGRFSRSLIVAMPTTPGLPGGGQLPNISAEISAVRAYLPDPVVLTEPGVPADEPVNGSSSIPTRANVLAHLPGCAIAHFACHGTSDPSDPSKSLLLLHDHNNAPLTVASLAPVQLDQLQLVYLSACRTAFTPALDLLDEAIHLTSAFQLAGSRHVIGTLWEIADATAVDIVTTFYGELHANPGTLDTDLAARALHHAARTVRDAYPHTPFLWAAYVHAGA